MSVNELQETTIIRAAGGRFAPGTTSPKPITHENAREMQARGVAKKRAVMLAAANKAVEDASLIDEFGEYAAVAERAQTLQRIATTPEAGKAAVMAHQALTQDTGMGEKQAVEQRGADDPVAQALNTLIQMLAGGQAQIVDGETIEGDDFDK